MTDDTPPFDAPLLGSWLSERVSTARLPDWVIASQLPAVDWKDGGQSPALSIVALLASSKEKDAHLFTAIRDRLDDQSMAELAWRLFELWQSADAPRGHRWVLDALAQWGGDSEMLRLAQLARMWPKQKKHPRVRQAVEVFAKNGGPAALAELDFLATSSSPAIRRIAAENLDEIAAARGLSREDLADGIVPTCGLSADGSRTIDLGSRRFLLQLCGDLTLEIRDESGKLLKGVPKATKNDDPMLAARAIESIKFVRKELKELVGRQALRLERAMVSGRTWAAGRWKEVFLAHPILRLLAQRTVWNALQQSNMERTFRVAEDLTLADENDDLFDLADIDLICVAHPLFWPSGLRETWRTIFADYRIAGLFDQIERATLQSTSAELGDIAVVRYLDAKVDSRSLMGLLRQKGWRPGAPVMGPITFVYFRPFEDHGVTAVLHHEGVYLANYRESLDVRLRDVAFVKGARTRMDGNGANPHDRLEIGQVPSIVFSETLRDVERVAGRH